MANTVGKWLRRIAFVALLGSTALSLLGLWRVISAGAIHPQQMEDVDELARHLLTGSLLALMTGTVTAGLFFRRLGLLTLPAGVVAGYAFDSILSPGPGPLAILSFGIGMPGLFVITVALSDVIRHTVSALKERSAKRPH